MADQTARLDKAMGALGERDAALYRLIFAAQARGEWTRAEALSRQIGDKRLMGSVLADRIERREDKTTPAELTAWLKAYPAQPEAAAFYEKAQKAGLKDLEPPEAPEPWRIGDDIDGAADFTPALLAKDDTTTASQKTEELALAIQKALRKRDPWTARTALIDAQNKGFLEGTFAHDAQAAIAASFFSAGERDEATALSTAAAGANQPLGLWVRGLIAWEKKDSALAARLFGRLTEHPALNESSLSAAHFWAYRAQSRLGEKAKAKEHLANAAKAPRSFYGLLASQLLGRDPVASLTKTAERSEGWNKQHRELLTQSPAGWRALALLQVGQTARAETELRRLSPQGDDAKLAAMIALANHIPMPALALRLGHLSNTRAFETSLYPILPWQPRDGFQIDRALLFALARQESLFDPAAVSHRGAQGLMQIMPSTADKMAALSDETAPKAAEENALLDPAYNMALGQRYVQHLSGISKIGNNLILLLAAYNAGPAKALNWAQSLDTTDPLLFLESIPVRETRSYVARVLPHYWAYRARLGKPNASLKDMAQGQWPRAPLTEDATLHLAQAGK